MRGNLGFNQLRDRVLADSHFAEGMIKFLESIILHSLHGQDGSPGATVSSTPPSPTTAESDSEFVQKLFLDSNAIARTRQLHSKRHTATCFKYRQPGSAHDSCRFGMPRDILETSKVDEYGIVHLARNNAWVNPWNPSIASCIRSNHDISWIPTVSKSLSLLYYITNYATKDDVSPGQMVTKAALLKHKRLIAQILPLRPALLIYRFAREEWTNSPSAVSIACHKTEKLVECKWRAHCSNFHRIIP